MPVLVSSPDFCSAPWCEFLVPIETLLEGVQVRAGGGGVESLPPTFK